MGKVVKDFQLAVRDQCIISSAVSLLCDQVRHRNYFLSLVWKTFGAEMGWETLLQFKRSGGWGCVFICSENL